MNYIFKNINLKLQYSNWFIEVKFKISDNKQLNKILNSDQMEKWENLKSRPKQRMKKKEY